MVNRAVNPHFRDVFENSPIGMSLVSRDGARFEVNRAMADFLGYTVEEIVGTDLCSPSPDDDALIESERLRKMVFDGEIDTYRKVHRYRRKDGRILRGEMFVTLARDDAGNPEYFIAQIVEITDPDYSNNISQQLTTAVDALAESVILCDADDRIVFCNKLFHDHNRPVVEYLEPGTPYKSFLRAIVDAGLVPDAKGREEQWLLERYEQRRNPKGPIVLLRQDGLWLLMHEQRLPDGGTMLIATDISKLRRAEQAVKDSETRLRDAIEAMPEGFALYDADERLVICNEPYRKTLPRIAALGLLTPGTKLEDIIRGGIKRGFTPSIYNDAEDYLTKRTHAFRHPAGPSEYETTAGQWIRFEERKTSDGGTVGIRSDITERKRAEQGLKQSQELFRNIIDNIPSAILLKDAEGRLTLVNKRFVEWYGISEQEALGKTTSDLFPKEFSGIVTHQDSKTMQTEQVGSVEVEVPFADNRIHTIHSTKFPVTDSTNGSPVVATIVTDLTEQRRSEEQLRQAQKMDAIGQLTGGVAHDFNNLLGIIIGNLDFLDESPAKDEEQQELITTALRAALQGAELTSRLLAFSRKQPLRPIVIDSNSLLDGMANLLRRTLGETITIRIFASAELKMIEVDPGQLETALLNLAVNARQAMPDGGQLTIETSNVELDRDYANEHAEAEPGPYVMLAVSDTGVGMAQNVLEHAFDPFFTTKQVGEGSGLGLSMVYGFVKQSGGHVSIYSKEGEGTTVKLYFSVTKAAALAVDGGPEKEPLLRGSGETILIVEDDDSLRGLAVKMVSDLGYKVEAVPDGPSAIAFLDEGAEIDVLFTDMILPHGMNGVALAKAASKRRPGLRVLYTSGYTENAIVNNSGIDEEFKLLGKPYRRGEVAKRLRETLEGNG